MRLAAFLFVLSACAPAATRSSGAKDAFIDASTGVVIAPRRTLCDVVSRCNSAPAAAPKSKQPQVSLPAVTGVRFSIELLKPSGGSLFVASDHPFRSGDRIRLHVTSNVNGRLTVFQSQDDAPFEQLFPDPAQSRAGHPVTSMSTVVLPNLKGDFEFDPKPGKLRVRLALLADPVAGPPLPLIAATPQQSTPTPAESPVSTPPTDAPAPTNLAQLPPDSLGVAGDDLTDFLRKSEGSKALRLHMDRSPKGAEEYAVTDVRLDKNAVPGVVVTDFTLTHRP